MIGRGGTSSRPSRPLSHTARLAGVGLAAMLAGCQALSSLSTSGDIKESAFRPSETPVTVDSVSRKTPAPGGNEDGILKQLFRNLGTRQIFGE